MPGHVIGCPVRPIVLRVGTAKVGNSENQMPLWKTAADGIPVMPSRVRVGALEHAIRVWRQRIAGAEPRG